MKRRKGATKHAGIELFVAVDGNDRWTGRLPAPNRGGTNGPFATVRAAQRAVRKLKAGHPLRRPVKVYLRGGRHELKAPLVLTPQDSGTPQEGNWPWGISVPRSPVVYCAYRNEQPVLSGGRRITGFKPQQLNGQTAWVATIPAVKQGRWYFRQLWVNGGRRPRPRLPKEGFFLVDRLARGDQNKIDPHNRGQSRFFFRKGDLKRWQNLSDVELVVFSFWIDSHAWLRSVDERKRLVTLDRTTRTDLSGEWGEQGARYLVENVFEALQEPGQWYLDRPAGKLYYLPLPGERLDTVEVIAPRLSEIVRLEGRSLDQAPVGCRVTHVGTYGIQCAEATEDVHIRRCRVTDLGAGGIKVWHGCRTTHIADCEIADGGHIFHAGVGVLIGQATGNRVVHNHIHDFDYTGVSVGWRWGYRESGGYGNLVEYNHIHHIGRGQLSDLGGIYTLGIAPGTRLRYNLIHDISSRGYGGWGIYPDEGSSYLLIEYNIVYDTKTGSFHQHYGRENVVRNNIFAYSQNPQLHRSRLEEHVSFLFERNIIIFDQGDLWHGEWSGERAVLQNNIYFNERRRTIRFPSKSGKQESKATFAQWQRRGLDRGSLIADPKFVNPGKRDFRLKKSSPALKLGFVPFDLSAVGPRKEAWENRRGTGPR